MFDTHFFIFCYSVFVVYIFSIDYIYMFETRLNEIILKNSHHFFHSTYLQLIFLTFKTVLILFIGRYMYFKKQVGWGVENIIGDHQNSLRH